MKKAPVRGLFLCGVGHASDRTATRVAKACRAKPWIVLFVVVFVVLDVFYSLRDISYWGMIPSISSDSHQRGIYTAAGTFTGSLGYNGLTIAVMPIVTFFSFDAGCQDISDAASGCGTFLPVS